MSKPSVRFCAAFALSLISLQGLAQSLSAVVIAPGSAPAAQAAPAQARGELLYATHCITCHTTQMHWRDQRSANNWPALMVQVRRWQDAASLAWSDDDILDVSRYLNESFYRFEPVADPISSASRQKVSMSPPSGRFEVRMTAACHRAD